MSPCLDHVREALDALRVLRDTRDSLRRSNHECHGLSVVEEVLPLSTAFVPNWGDQCVSFELIYREVATLRAQNDRLVAEIEACKSGFDYNAKLAEEANQVTGALVMGALLVMMVSFVFHSAVLMSRENELAKKNLRLFDAMDNDVQFTAEST